MALRSGGEGASCAHPCLRHERLSVAVALAEAPHHGSGPSTKKVVERRERQGEEDVWEEYDASRGPKTPPPSTRPGLSPEPARGSDLRGGRSPNLGLPVSGRGVVRPWTPPLSPSSSSSTWRRRRRRNSVPCWIREINGKGGTFFWHLRSRWKAPPL